MMNLRVLSQLIALVLLVLIVALSGCSPVETAEQALDTVEEQLEADLDNQPAPPGDADSPNGVPVTREEAESIALARGGFTPDQVQGLHTEYEVDDGIPEYEVEFFQGGWEYDCTIHAETGQILSWDQDDD